LPVNLSVDVDALFADFERAVSDTTSTSQQDKRKETLQKILDTIQKSAAAADQPVKENQVDPIDIDSIILPNICKIMNFYNLVSDLCPNENIKIVTTPVGKANASSTVRWKILLWVVGI
jgi:hypothetical protein